ncbi:MAG: response regulator, partial [Oscillospiraceae bacterium]|nr:response regulator [Oscillospiraceae bacterium]
MKWIAIVDDDMTNLNIAGQILSKNQMRVSIMKSGTALLKFMQTNSPDLILLDIAMPVMDGFETLQRLRGLEETMGRSKTPVIFLTADQDTATESRGFEMGVADFIRKPFVPEILLKRIGNTVAQQAQINKFEA